MIICIDKLHCLKDTSSQYFRLNPATLDVHYIQYKKQFLLQEPFGQKRLILTNGRDAIGRTKYYIKELRLIMQLVYPLVLLDSFALNWTHRWGVIKYNA